MLQQWTVKLLVIVTYIIMLAANILSNALPLNNLTTKEVSDIYFNLFAPAGITFAIWGIIYLLLLLYVFYVVMFGQRQKQRLNNETAKQIALLFALSSLFNGAWIFAWHYLQILLSAALMLGLLGCLMTINLLLKNNTLSTAERWFVRLPFSVYFGWITVATIANMTALLVGVHWNRFGLSDLVWTNSMLVIGTLIGTLTAQHIKSISYLFVFIWAYAGIIIRHSTEFSFAYPSMIGFAAGGIVIFLLFSYYIKHAKERISR